MPWVGVSEVRSALQKVSAQADLAAKEMVVTSASIVTKAAQLNFQGAHKRGQPHVGGDQPNVVSGALRRSIRMEPVHRFGLASYSTLVGPHLIYGRRVELGMNGSKAYPYFAPAVESTHAELEAAAQRIWRRFL